MTYVMAITATLITAAMVVYPDVAFQSAVKGLRLWWDIVFPALLPFFIGSEILMGLGVVHFMGVLLEPLMRPLFNCPGAGSFVLAMGLASGYPLGAILTARLRRQALCSKTEAERLMTVSNTADPLFMSGACAVGMFQAPWVGNIICAGHYLSVLLVGLLMRFYKMLSKDRSKAIEAPGGNMLARALGAMMDFREKDGRPFGQVAGEAVRQSVNSLLLIGGFIILFSSIIAVLDVVGVTHAIAEMLTALLAPLGVDTKTIPALVSGIFEITNGTQIASQAGAPLPQRVMAATAIITWSGISVHMQVAAMIQGTDINMAPYVGARLLQATIAGAIALWLTGPGPSAARGLALPVFAAIPWGAFGWPGRLGFYAAGFLKTTGFLIGTGLLVGIAGSTRNRARRP